MAPRGDNKPSAGRRCRESSVLPQPALSPHFLPFAALLQVAAGDVLQLDAPMWLTSAPGVFGVVGGPGEHTSSPTLHVGLSRSVYSAIQNRVDDQVHIRILGAAAQGGTLEWAGELSDIYTKKGPPRSLAVLTALFDQTESTSWMMRLVATMIGLRRTHQLNTPKFGFSLVVWSRLPVGGGFANDLALMTSTGMAFKASTGLDKKRVDGVRVARAMVHGAKEVLGERLPMGDALACALAEQNCGVLIEHGMDPDMHWVPVPEKTFLAAADLGLGPIADPEMLQGAAVGADMGLAHVNKSLKKEKKPMLGGWAQVTPKEFEGGLRTHVPARENGKDWLKAFARSEEEVAELVDPERAYRERASAEHSLREAGRVQRFVENLTEYARTKREDHLTDAGKALGSSQRSLRDKCGIKSAPVDELFAEIGNEGTAAGFFGCRLADSGRHSVVVILAHAHSEERLREILDEFGKRHNSKTGVYLNSGRGAAVIGWWEGVLQPKEEPAEEAAPAPAPAAEEAAK